MSSKYTNHWVAVREQSTVVKNGELLTINIADVLINLANVLSWAEVYIASHEKIVSGSIIYYGEVCMEVGMNFPDFHKMMRKYYKENCSMVSPKSTPFAIYPCKSPTEIVTANTDDPMEVGTFELAVRADTVSKVEINEVGDVVLFVDYGNKGMSWSYDVLAPNLPNLNDVILKQLNSLY